MYDELEHEMNVTSHSCCRSMGTSVTGDDSASQVAALEAMFASRQ